MICYSWRAHSKHYCVRQFYTSPILSLLCISSFLYPLINRQHSFWRLLHVPKISKIYSSQMGKRSCNCLPWFYPTPYFPVHFEFPVIAAWEKKNKNSGKTASPGATVLNFWIYRSLWKSDKRYGPCPIRNAKMHKQNGEKFQRPWTSASQWISVKQPWSDGKKKTHIQLAQFPVPPLPGMRVLFNRVWSFKRDAHGALRERGDTCPVRHIS